MFVGVHRQAEVGRLVTLFELVRRQREPALVAYHSPQGWGKTRIVQEFYDTIVAEQSMPPFWPALPTTNGVDMVQRLVVGRKTVGHRHAFTPPSEAILPWLWLAPPIGRLSDGSPAPALPGMYEQAFRFIPRSDQSDQSEQSRLHSLGVPIVIVLDDAHDLDAATTEVVAGLLATDLPILVVATTWAAIQAANTPFTEFLSGIRDTDRVTIVHLGALTTDELAAYVVAKHPGTDPRVCGHLAERASCNPYVLQLLLATPRVRDSIVGGRITLPSDELSNLSGRLDHLIEQDWQRLSRRTRQLLVAAALLGPSFVQDVLAAVLRPLAPRDAVGAALDDAIAASWIRPLDGTGRLLEFVELLRHEAAARDAPNVLSAAQRTTIRTDALRAATGLLATEPAGAARVILLSLHVTLASDGVSTDLDIAARSAMELADRARSEHRRPAAIEHLRTAAAWFAAVGDRRGQVDCQIQLAAVVRVEHRRQDAEPVAMLAVEVADRHLPPGDELRVHARLALAAARRRRSDPVAYQSCADLLVEAATMVNQLPEPSAQLRCELWASQLSARADEGDYAGAAAESQEFVEFCEQQFGRLHTRTIDALQDLGYRLQRSHPTAAVAVRRDVLERRRRRAGSTTDLPTAAAKIDMAVALLATGADEHLAEAKLLTDQALSLWARIYGLDGARTMRARLVRARVLRRRGFAIELAGDEAAAQQHYLAAAAETGHVLQYRSASGFPAEDADLAIGLQRHGESLGYLRDPAAIALLDGALRTREVQLRQDAGFWATRSCAHSLWWTYQRLRLLGDAAFVARQYNLRNFGGPPP